MKIFICIDDNNGTAFNNRRQSKDRILSEKILSIVGENKLFIRPYSKTAFPESENVFAYEEYLDMANENDFCFVEGQPLLPFADKIDRVYLFRWNRSYPFDKKFDLPLLSYHMTTTEDFVGSSHEKITMEVYEK